MTIFPTTISGRDYSLATWPPISFQICGIHPHRRPPPDLSASVPIVTIDHCLALPRHCPRLQICHPLPNASDPRSRRRSPLNSPSPPSPLAITTAGATPRHRDHNLIAVCLSVRRHLLPPLPAGRDHNLIASRPSAITSPLPPATTSSSPIHPPTHLRRRIPASSPTSRSVVSTSAASTPRWLVSPLVADLCCRRW